MMKNDHEAPSTLPILIVALFVSLLSVIGVSAAPPSQQEAQKKLAGVQARIQDTQRKLDKLERELREAEKSIGQINRRLDSNATALKSGQQRLHALKARREHLLNESSRHHDVLRMQAKIEYLYSGQEKLKLLLNQQDPAMVSRMLIYYDYLRRARTRKIERAKQVLQSIHQIQSDILKQQNLTKRIQDDLLHERQQLQRQQRKRESVRAGLGASLKKDEKHEKQLQELIENLQDALVNVPTEAGRQEKFYKLKGKLFWPVVGKPSNRFGQRRNEVQGKLNWRGVFIPSNEGNNVRSIFDGRVVFAEWLRGFGLLIIISHGDDYMSLYGHNQSLYKKPGEWVAAGERIATVGNSGGNTRTGLYFEIRKQGKPVNPSIWCVKPASGRRSG